MTLIALALSMLLQQEGWQETSFHRVHLRNGNFIDGRVISDKPSEVVLLLKVGEFSVRRDQIDHVELVKLKSYNEKPIVLTTPKKPTVANPANPNTPAPVVKTPEEIKKRVEAMIFKIKTTPGGEPEFPIQELTQLGEDGVAYLASRAPGQDPRTLNAMSAALIVLKPTPKVTEVLDSLVGNTSAGVRVMAATVLVVSGGEPAKAKYLRPLMADGDAKVRETALGLLGTTEDKDWFELMAEMSGDAVKEVRLRAMRNARAIATKHELKERFIRSLAENLGHPESGVRTDSAAMIGAMNQREAWSLLAPVLSDPEAPVRAAVAQAIMTLAVPESADAILGAMGRETDRSTRIFLAGAVQKLRLMKGIDIVIPWLDDPQEDIRKVAEGTLKSLSGQNLGMDRAKWDAWNRSRPR